jgi:hypothetical protein
MKPTELLLPSLACSGADERLNNNNLPLSELNEANGILLLSSSVLDGPTELLIIIICPHWCLMKPTELLLPWLACSGADERLNNNNLPLSELNEANRILLLLSSVLDGADGIVNNNNLPSLALDEANGIVVALVGVQWGRRKVE